MCLSQKCTSQQLAGTMASSGSKRANMVGDHAGHQRKGSDVSPYGKEESGLPNYSSANSDTSDPLDTLGYVAELPRNRSTLQVTFMSFVLASVPYGLATTLYYPLVRDQTPPLCLTPMLTSVGGWRPSHNHLGLASCLLHRVLPGHFSR